MMATRRKELTPAERDALKVRITRILATSHLEEITTGQVAEILGETIGQVGHIMGQMELAGTVRSREAYVKERGRMVKFWQTKKPDLSTLPDIWKHWGGYACSNRV